MLLRMPRDARTVILLLLANCDGRHVGALTREPRQAGVANPVQRVDEGEAQEVAQASGLVVKAQPQHQVGDLCANAIFQRDAEPISTA